MQFACLWPQFDNSPASVRLGPARLNSHLPGGLMRTVVKVLTFLALLAGPCFAPFHPAGAQELQKINIGYSGTGITQYTLEIARRQGIFRKNGLDPVIVYVGSGSLLSQALIAGSFDVAFSQGSESVLAK